MNLLDQIKPQSEEKQINTTVILAAPKPKQKQKETTVIHLTSVVSLDSGELTKIENQKDIAYEEIKINETEYSIYNLQSLCYKYLIYFKEFANINKISKEHSAKFSTQIESIYRINDNILNKNLISYLDTIYDKLQFEISVPVQSVLNSENITLNDSIHFKDNIVIVPPSYDSIIDYILNSLDRTFDTIQFSDILSTTRDIKPTVDLKILHINQQYCHSCKFFSVCDDKNKNKIGG